MGKHALPENKATRKLYESIDNGNVLPRRSVAHPIEPDRVSDDCIRGRIRQCSFISFFG